ncbi:hypothetical protein D3C76_1597340 [compost metagenome]
MEHRVIYQKGPAADVERMAELFASESAEQQLESLQQELDNELERLYEALQQGDTVASEASKEKLRKLRMELIRLEW